MTAAIIYLKHNLFDGLKATHVDMYAGTNWYDDCGASFY